MSTPAQPDRLVVESDLDAIPGLIWAYQFDNDGQATRRSTAQVDPAEFARVAAAGGWLWLHLFLTDTRSQHFLATLELPPRALALLASRDDHPCLHLEGGTAYGVVVDWHYETDTAAKSPAAGAVAALRFALTDGLIVSARMHPLKSVDALRERLERGERLDSSGHVLESVIEQFVNSVGEANANMRDQLDALEDRVLDEVVYDERHALGLLRRQAVRLHRPLIALQRVMRQFEQRYANPGGHPLVGAAVRLSHRIDDLDADVLAIEKRAALLHDTVAAELTEQTNRHLYVLSVLTSMLLPPTLITGLFGMNTGGLPFSGDNEYGSAIAFGICVLVSGVSWLVLRRLGITR